MPKTNRNRDSHHTMADQWSRASTPSVTGKRKRSTASADRARASSLPASSINPHSYPPSTLLQLTVAGLSETDELPSRTIPGFPHRRLSSNYGASGSAGAESDAFNDTDTTASGKGKGKSKANKGKVPVPDREGHVDVLIRAIHQFLDQGAIAKAARAYGVILQMRPHGKLVDIRHHDLWAIGAEILMREGEQPVIRTKKGADDDDRDDPDIDNEDSSRPRRWGSAANLNKLKAYFDTLISQYPYDYRRPQRICAVDFWLTMLGCEVYNAHAEHVMSLARVDEEEPEWNDEDGPFDPDGERAEDRHGKEDARRDELRLQALTAMKDIIRRMDGIMQDPPYSKSKQFLRLRAMVSLYVADLVVPVFHRSPVTMERALRAREMEQRSARDFLQRMVENGGELDHVTSAILNSSQEQQQQRGAAPLYPSLPIREV